MMKKLLLFFVATTLCATSFSQTKARPTTKDAIQHPVQMMTATGMEDLHATPTFPAKNGSEIVSIGETEIGQTYYDWQTNSGPLTRTVVWPDGCLNACWTSSMTEAFGDRGTAVAYFDGTNWTPSNARIENVKTGFGSIARYGENGLVTAAHTSSTIIICTTDDHTLKGTWTQNEMTNAHGAGWPAVMTSGENRNIIHVLADANDALYYYRSKDGGKTWDIMDQQLEWFTAPYASSLGSNCYRWMETTDNNRLALVISYGWSDGEVIYSDDNGDTWQRIQFYQHPGINNTYDAIFFYPRYVAADWDANGDLHLAYEFNGTTGAPASGSYYPGIGGVAYWNENDYSIMDTASIHSIYMTGWYYSDATGHMPNNYIGYLCPLNESGNTYDPYTATSFDFGDYTHGAYNQGLVGMPDFFINKGRMFCFYVAISDGQALDGLQYYRLYATNSQDGGENWTLPQIITKGMIHSYDEVIYPYAFHTVSADNVIRGYYQVDGQPESFVMGKESVPDDNFMKAFSVTLDEIDGIADNSSIVNEMPAVKVYPNPASDNMTIYYEKEAKIVVYNALGQKVLSFNHDGMGDNEFNISSLSSGVYFVTAYCGNASTTSKLIVK